MSLGPTSGAGAAIYMDSSAVLKLIRREVESAALQAWLRPRSTLISSALLRVEVWRALKRLQATPAEWLEANALLASITTVDIDAVVLDLAGALEPAVLRTLDALHVATARKLGSSITEILTYDRRLRAAAEAAGIRVQSPGSESITC